MKIYQTETQADYDALMVKLEAQGCAWSLSFHRKLTEVNNWHINEHLTCLRVYNSKVNHASLNYYKEEYPNIPIIKYKAKADDKMKFTKENVLNLTGKWIKSETISFKDVQDGIKELDDTPEKVVVPKYVADWIEWNKESEVSLQIMLKCYEHFYVNRNSNCLAYGEKAVQWYVDNPYKFIQAYEDGYTIESEQLYYIPLPHLETAGGTKQYLTKSGAGNYFALSPCIGQKQRYTKEELKQVPEIYKPYAKLIEEATE